MRSDRYIVLLSQAFIFNSSISYMDTYEKKENNSENLKAEVKNEFISNLYKLLQVSVGLQRSSLNCERSISAMRRVKT